MRNAAREWYPKVGNLRDELLPGTGKTPKGKRPQGRIAAKGSNLEQRAVVWLNSEEELKATRGMLKGLSPLERSTARKPQRPGREVKGHRGIEEPIRSIAPLI